jgi:hypothetical protein
MRVYALFFKYVRTPLNGLTGFSSLPTHSCGLLLVEPLNGIFTISSPRSQPKSESGVSAGIPWGSALNFLNIPPCRRFAKGSPSTYVYGKCFRVMYPDVIRSFMKKYPTRICLVRLLLDSLPLFSRSIALRLSSLSIYS